MSCRLPKYWPPTPLSARRVCIPRLCCRGRTHSPGGEGGGGQCFGRRKTQLCTLPISNPLWPKLWPQVSPGKSRNTLEVRPGLVQQQELECRGRNNNLTDPLTRRLNLTLICEYSCRRKDYSIRFPVYSIGLASMVLAPSCKRPRTAQQTLFLSFAINNCFPIMV
jgi:hypothetical protein